MSLFGNATDFGYVGSGSDFAAFGRLIDQVDNGQTFVAVNYGSALELEGDHAL